MTIQIFSWPAKPDLPIHVFRLDQNHEILSGNKLYKLQPWLQKAGAEKLALLSCGGAWSNHLHALAFAGQQQGLPTYGLVRGLEENNLTFTMQDCANFGMKLIPVTREEYRQRYTDEFVLRHLERLGERALWVPEGGTDELAVTVCEQIGQRLNSLLESSGFSSVWLAVGSGGTIVHYDGGADWNEHASGVRVSLNDVWGTSSGAVFAVGASGAILRGER